MSTLGQQLKQLRNNKKLSQPEFAQQVGIEQSYLSKLENDKSIPSNEIFRALLILLLTLNSSLSVVAISLMVVISSSMTSIVESGIITIHIILFHFNNNPYKLISLLY